MTFARGTRAALVDSGTPGLGAISLFANFLKINQSIKQPSKQAGSDPEAFWLRPVMGSIQPELGQIVYAGSDFTHPFQLRFSKKAWITLCKTDPDLIWMAWSGLGQTHLVWKLVCRNHLARFPAGHNRPTTRFPLSDSVSYFHRRPG